MKLAQRNRRKLLFPRRKRFEQLFKSAAPFDSKKPRQCDGQRVSRFCTHSGADGHKPSKSVTPSEDVLRAILTASEHVSSLSLYWSLTDRNDGTTLVTAQWDQIIGSIWVAIIRTDSIPAV